MPKWLSEKCSYISYLIVILKIINVFILTSPFQKNKNYYANSKNMDLAIKTNDSIEIVKHALKALKYI